ncbi:MAG TPA: hypothetical protein VLH94_04260 [Spirochaetia bacterium]|nr:hypothetical protein [Spirochaetia bacterium]
MNCKQESVFARVVAMLVLFTTMLDPIVSASLEVVILVGISIYKFTHSKKSK